MQCLFSGFLIFVLTLCAFPRTFADKGQFGITVGDNIEAVEFLDEDRKLLLVGNFTATIWDIDRHKMIGKIVFGKNDEINFAALNATKTRVLSADIRARLNATEWRNAAVYDLRGGRKIFDFDRRVSSGFWSANNKTLVTSDRADIKPEITTGGVATELSFWDGESFEYRKSVFFEKLHNAFLSSDGERLFVHSADANKVERIEIYDALSGSLRSTLFTSGESRTIRNAPLYSPTGLLFGVVVTDRTGGDTKTLLIWATDGTERPIREIATKPAISSSDFVFSPDEKFVAVDAGKKVQIIDLQSGKTTANVGNSALPLFWTADNSIFLYGETGVRVADGATAYRYETIYETVEQELPGGSKETRVIDFSSRIPSPDGNMFLIFSNEKLTIFDSRNGKILSRLVELPGSNKKRVLDKLKKIVLFEGRKVLVRKANWSDDARFVYALDGELGTLTLWQIR